MLFAAVAGWRLSGAASGDHAHDVALLHDQEILAVELDFGSRPFAEQHAVTDLEIDRDQLAGFVAAARTHRRDFALRGLFLGRVGNDDAALGLFLGVDTLDHDAVMQRTKFGFSHDGSSGGLVCWSDLPSKVAGNTGVFDTAEGRIADIFGNRTLRVPIARPGYGVSSILSSKVRVKALVRRI